MFNCDDIFEKTDEYLDGELSEDERISFEAHIEVCGECRKNVEFAKSINCVMRDMPSVLPPEDFLDSLHSKIEADKKIVSFYRRWQPYGALAACILLAVIIRTNIVGDLNRASDYLQFATPAPSASTQSVDDVKPQTDVQPEAALPQTPETKEDAEAETVQLPRSKEVQRKNDEPSDKTADTAFPTQADDKSDAYTQPNGIQQSAAVASDSRSDEVKEKTDAENGLENYAAKVTPFGAAAFTNDEGEHTANNIVQSSVPVPTPTELPQRKSQEVSFILGDSVSSGVRGGGSSGAAMTAAAPTQAASEASCVQKTANTVDKKYKSEVEQLISELGISGADGEYTASATEYEKFVMRLEQKGIEFDGLHTQKGNSVHFSIEWR